MLASVYIVLLKANSTQKKDTLLASVYIVLLKANRAQKKTLYIVLLKAYRAEKKTLYKHLYTLYCWRLIGPRKRHYISLCIHCVFEGL